MKLIRNNLNDALNIIQSMIENGTSIYHGIYLKYKSKNIILADKKTASRFASLEVKKCNSF
jgi:hypothetical protein